MLSNACYRINSPKVMNEIIDGEAVLVNLDTGAYYSIDKVGSFAWSSLSQGLSIGQTVDAISGRYQVDPKVIETDIFDFVRQLEEEDLIVPEKESRSATPSVGSVDPASEGSSGSELKYEKPVLHKYTDMEDLLLLDPIHDVDDMGWPHTNPNKG
jgi:hypothetical protein